MSSARFERGALVARLLSGAWRTTPQPPPDLTATTLEQVLEQLLQSGAAPLGWWRIRSSELASTPAGQRLRTAYRMQSLRAAEHQRQIGLLMKKFRGRGLDPILLKGWSLARRYAEPGLRPYSDVDLIVAPQQMGAASALLSETNGISVDLQHDEIDRFDQRCWQDLYSRSQLRVIGETEVRVLGDEDHLRALCIHFLKHGGWAPLWLCDIALLVESRSPTFNWDLCLGKVRKQRSWITCALLLAHQLLGMEVAGVPREFQPYKLPRWLTRTVIEKWGSPPPVYRADFRSCLRHPAKISEAIAERWPPNPIVSTLTSGVPFGLWPRKVLQSVEILLRVARCFLAGAERKSRMRANAA